MTWRFFSGLIQAVFNDGGVKNLSTRNENRLNWDARLRARYRRVNAPIHREIEGNEKRLINRAREITVPEECLTRQQTPEEAGGELVLQNGMKIQR